MSYDDLTPEQQGLIDEVMELRTAQHVPMRENRNGCLISKNHVRTLAKIFHCKERTMKERLLRVYRHYEISHENFIPMVRLAYLRSKELGLVCLTLFVLVGIGRAQAATRPVVLTWTASTSSSVTGYAVLRCATISPATACTPNPTSTPLATVSGTTYTDNPNTQTTYGYSVVALAPACTPTTPTTTPCGSSAAATLTAVPVPPQTAGATNVIIVVP